MAEEKINMSPLGIEKYLEGLDYPALKKEIVAKIKEHTKDESIISMAERLPNQRYDSPNDLWRELGKMGEEDEGKRCCC